MARAAKPLVFALGPEVGSAVLENTLSVLVTPGHSASNKKGPRKGRNQLGCERLISVHRLTLLSPVRAGLLFWNIATYTKLAN
jgi:hypothetical protein